MEIKVDSEIPEGVGIVLDANGVEIARVKIPSKERPPKGGHTLVVSLEDFAVMLRVASGIMP